MSDRFETPQIRPGALLEFYRDHASTVLLPFWIKAIDRHRGGIFTCFDNTGRNLVSRNKYTWSQGRFVWLWSRLASLAARGLLPGDAAEYLRDAKRTVDFLESHVFLANSNCAYVLSESGEPIESAPGQGYDTSIYADCFVILGFAEYARVAHDNEPIERAIRLYDTVCQRIARNDFRTEPYPIPEGFRAHGVTMILLRVSQCLAAALESRGHPRAQEIRQRIADYIEEILAVFVLPDGLVSEMLTARPASADTLLARHFTPGHACECMWFIMTEAVERDRKDWIGSAARTIRKSIELGWDEQYGGVLRFVDRDGGMPKGASSGDPFDRLIRDTWDTKIWWPQVEALYALLLAYRTTGDVDFWSSYQRLHEYVFRTFPNPDATTGEWIQIRDRQGQPLNKIVALPVKDPYHILQSVMLVIELESAKRSPASNAETGNR